jgi:hypothetical protein
LRHSPLTSVRKTCKVNKLHTNMIGKRCFSSKVIKGFPKMWEVWLSIYFQVPKFICFQVQFLPKFLWPCQKRRGSRLRWVSHLVLFSFMVTFCFEAPARGLPFAPTLLVETPATWRLQFGARLLYNHRLFDPREHIISTTHISSPFWASRTT